MAINAISWEQQLLVEAHSALENWSHIQPAKTNTPFLRQAYAYCATLTRHHSKTFYLASALLPKEQKEAVQALYAFCRVSDDIIDRRGGNRAQMLASWRQRSLSTTPPEDSLVSIAWMDARTRYNIPLRYAEQLLDGVALDLTPPHYETFEELAVYCYGVASTVGLMAMHVIGYESEEAIPYAIKLGVALQLTNILRDVAEDWGNGRCYLPTSELAQFNITKDDIAHGRVNDNWRAFMRFQINRTRQLFQEAMPGIHMLGEQGRMAIASAAELYLAILNDIERHDYDVFSRRAHTTAVTKLTNLPKIWWRTQMNKY